MVVSVDFAAAFDTFDREFLFRALKSYNFGEAFRNSIGILYKGACRSVVNNGFTSNWFSLEAGLRQGCPVSPLLFIIAVEKLSCCLRQDFEIQGALINDNRHIISQYADDTTLFLRDGSSLERSMEVIEEFSQVAGLSVNVDKSQGLKVHSQTVLGTRGSAIQWKDSIEVLGLEFNAIEEGENRSLGYFDKYIEKMQGICNRWSKRAVSLKGKVTILNSLVYPIIYYAATTLVCTPRVFERVKSLTSKFLWCGGSAKIAFYPPDHKRWVRVA